ncbi:MAG: A24 family peptidase [Pseudomonadales bacterium]
MLTDGQLASQLMTYGWAGALLLGWLGLCVGSFLNVVIYRIPLMLQRQWEVEAHAVLAAAEERECEAPANGVSVARPAEPFNLLVPRSRCPQCGHQIRAWENIPVISWLALRGRCAGCRARISPRYPLVELLTGVATLAVIGLFGFTWAGGAALVYTWVLIALTFIDYDTQLLPDQLTLPLVWLGLVVNLGNGFTSLDSAVVGAIAGYLFLWSTYWAFKLITGKEGMGYGDFKLFAAVGAWLGWQVLPATILIAACVGLLYALATSILGKRVAQQPIPFGPFLAIAGWVSLTERDTVLALFLS